MRLVEVRLLDGPNLYRLEPAVKVELALGRRRTWYGARLPERHAIVRLGAPVPARLAPAPVNDLAAWVRRLHRLSGADAWLSEEPGPDGHVRRTLPVTVHRTSEPGHWVVAFPWREGGRAREIAQAAWRLADRGIDPRARAPGSAASRGRRRRGLARLVERIGAASTEPPGWIRDAQRGVPAVSISGTNGKSTTTRMITHILRLAGKRVGTTTSDGILIDEELVEAGDLTGPAGARQILARPDLEVAVLETARGGLVMRGVGYESNDAAVLTNVSPDHLDLHGLHTLPELAEVKSVIARITRPEGLVVVNGDDALLVAATRRLRAPVCFFSLEPRSPRMRRHLARDGRALLFEDGWLVEVEGGRRHRILKAADAPATLFGLARHNVANALAAAGGARGMGATRAEVAAGLRDFRPAQEHAPGRLNLYRVGSRLVIVDFAHNEAGLSVVLDVAEGICGPRDARRWPLTAIVGTAGDRPDDALRGIGRIAARRADRLVIKETKRYLRGRTRESVIGEIRTGMLSAGAKRSAIRLYEGEAEAMRAVLAEGPDEPEIVVIMCHADREGVAAVLEGAGGQAVDVTAELPALLDGIWASAPQAR